MAEFGFVKIVSGVHKYKIGRYIRNDERAGYGVVALSYDTDILPYSHCISVTKKSLSNDVNLKDIIVRLENIEVDLKQIDLRAHKKIKKYGEQHSLLLMEYNYLRMYYHFYLSFMHMNKMHKENNIVMICDQHDEHQIYDILLDLYDKDYHTTFYDFSMQLDQYLEKCDHVCLFMSQHTLRAHWYEDVCMQLKQLKELKDFTISLIQIDKNMSSSFEYNLSVPFSEQYELDFEHLLNKLGYL